MEKQSNPERGAVLLGVVLIVLMLTLLGMVSMNLAMQEMLHIRADKDEAAARHLAEAGSDVIIGWFHNWNSAPAGASAQVAKHFDLPNSGPSFFDASGQSQFSGSSAAPDISYDMTRTADDRLMNDPINGWFRSLHGLGRIQMMKVYAPTRPGLLCSVEITAKAKHYLKTVSLQLGAVEAPALRAAVQVGQGIALGPSMPLPVEVHWGDLKIKGDVQLGRREDIPVQTTLASVTGQTYADMTTREDRWLNIFAGGEAIFLPSSSSSTSLPSNVHPRRDPFPGLHADVWPYDLLKKYALQYGSYYARDSRGLLYRNGTMGPGLGLTVEEVFRSRAVGQRHGLVFVDTLDQQAPRPDNLGTVIIDTDYAEGLFIVNAHVEFKPKGPGAAMTVLSPPKDGSTSFAARVPVTLSGIHLNGVLSSPGDLLYEGQPRVFGALLIDGRVVPASSTPTPLEVWYDYDFRNGLFRGLPVVYVASGTWQEKY